MWNSVFPIEESPRVKPSKVDYIADRKNKTIFLELALIYQKDDKLLSKIFTKLQFRYYGGLKSGGGAGLEMEGG